MDSATNKQVVDELIRSGDDVSVPRDVNFSFIFTDDRSINLFIESLKMTHFIHDIYRKDNGDFDVTLTIYMVPALGMIDDLESQLQSAAMVFSGRYDGWGCFCTRSH